MTAGLRVFWIDTDYDRENASDGVSRFAAYVRQAADGFTEDAGMFDDDPAAAWAARAWNTACPPVMCPGYVARHPRVLSARAERDDFDGDLLLTVELISALPEPVARAAGWPWRSWEYPPWSERFSYPELRQAGHKALLPAMTAHLLVNPRSVFPRAGADMPGWRDAAAAVRAICHVLNDGLGPIVAALDEGR